MRTESIEALKINAQSLKGKILYRNGIMHYLGVQCTQKYKNSNPKITINL